jgi:hypothetical protein
MSDPYKDYKWSVHVIGPDDIEPCESFEDAVMKAAGINAAAIEIIESGRITKYHPILYAQIIMEAK